MIETDSFEITLSKIIFSWNLGKTPLFGLFPAFWR